MANINPLVAVAKELANLDAPEDACIHLCVYHSRFPLAIRSYLENKLDHLLKRNPKNGVWPPDELLRYLARFEQRNHIFIVLASPVAEVGRDHDYDWAIIEPSSMRSIIQVAGRVLRHRDMTPKQPNILILDKNIKCLNGKDVCFDKPGFELAKFNFKMEKHDLTSILKKQQYQNINSAQRAIEPEGYKEEFSNNLVSLEHKALLEQLFQSSDSAKVWWKEQPYWCGEVQKQQRFRDSIKDEALYLLLKDEAEYWQWKNESVYPAKFGELSGAGITIETISNLPMTNSNYFWFELNALDVYHELARDLGVELTEIGYRFGEIRIIEYGNNNIEEYIYHSNLGMFQEVER
jgi:CRISPR-associated endonuclease/helicase Cas3